MYFTIRRVELFILQKQLLRFPEIQTLYIRLFNYIQVLDVTKSAVRLLMKIIHLRVLILNSKRSFPQHSLTFWAGTQQHSFFSQAASDRSVVCVCMNLSLFGKGARALIFQTVMMKRTRAWASSDVCVVSVGVISLVTHVLREITVLSHAEWPNLVQVIIMTTSATWLDLFYTTFKHEGRKDNRFGHTIKYTCVDCISMV